MFQEAGFDAAGTHGAAPASGGRVRTKALWPRTIDRFPSTGEGSEGGTRTAQVGSAIIVGGDALALLLLVGLTGDWPAALGLTSIALFILAATGSYRMRLALGVLDDLPLLVAKLAVPSLALVALSMVTVVPTQWSAQAALLPVAIFGARLVTYPLVRSLRRRGLLLERALIVGSGQVAQELIRRMRAHPEYGLVPVGYVEDCATPGIEGEIPYLGSLAAMEQTLEELQLRHVVVAFSPTREHASVDAIRAGIRMGAEVSVVPRFFDMMSSASTGHEHIWGIPLVHIRKSVVASPAWRVKRLIDIVVAGVALLVMAPILGFVALMVRITSPGPVIFRQPRIGQDGRVFQMLKFRSLHAGREDETRWAVSNELPMTPIGRFLRRTNLDELPQLWNILRGDMSLVGPRPEEPHFVGFFSQEVQDYRSRHRVPTGLTGLAQVQGLRGDRRLEPISERTRFDNRYIEDWSLWRDFIIFVRTLGTVVKRGST